MRVKNLTDLAIQLIPDELYAQIILGKVDQEAREILMTSMRKSMTEKERQKLDHLKRAKKMKSQKERRAVQY